MAHCPSTMVWAHGGATDARVSVGATLAMFITTFLLTRQTQVPFLNGLAAPWALLMVLFCLRWQPTLGMLIPMTAYGGCSMLLSMLAARDPENAVRFFVVITGTLLAFHFRPVRIAVGWALLPVVAQAAIIAGVSLGLTLAQDVSMAGAARAMAIDTGWGDVYSFDGVYYRVQVIGNALLPLLFLIGLWRWSVSRLYRVMTVFALIGLGAAGNLTYWLVAALALMMRQGRLAMRRPAVRALGLIATVAGLAAGWGNLDELLGLKFDGSDSSMGVRFDQVHAAFAQFAATPLHLLFGAGLGAPFPDGRERNYSEFQYIELQSLYLSLQLGVAGMALYLGTLWISARRFLNADGRRIFWLYMLAGISNPYILDTNQILATALLVCLFSPPARRLPAQVRTS